MKELVQKVKDMIRKLCLKVKGEWPSFKRLINLVVRLVTKKIPKEGLPAAKTEAVSLLSQTKTTLTLGGIGVVLVFLMLLRGCGDSSTANNKNETGLERLSPAERAKRLAATYSSENYLLYILHSGGGRVPVKGRAYWAVLNYVKFTGCDSFDVFTSKDDYSNIYYDFCVESQHRYIDNERLRDGYYVYVGDREYTTVTGSTRRLYCFRELDEATSAELGKILAQRAQ